MHYNASNLDPVILELLGKKTLYVFQKGNILDHIFIEIFCVRIRGGISLCSISSTLINTLYMYFVVYLSLRTYRNPILLSFVVCNLTMNNFDIKQVKQKQFIRIELKYIPTNAMKIPGISSFFCATVPSTYCFKITWMPALSVRGGKEAPLKTDKRVAWWPGASSVTNLIL